MRIARAAESVRLMATVALGLLITAGALSLPGCGGGEGTQTGTVVKQDPDREVRNKAMEDYMKSQTAKKK